MQGIYCRGRIFWLRWTPPGGARQYRSLETTDEAEAIVRAREIMNETPLAHSGSWSNEIEWHLAKKEREDKDIGARHIPDLRYTLHHVAKQLASAGAESPLLTRPFHVLKWLGTDHEKKPGRPPDPDARNEPPKQFIKARTLRSYADDARRFFAALEKARKIGESPFTDVALPEARKTVRRNFLTEDEAGKLLDQAGDGDLGFVVRCALFAGLRKGETLEAKRDWFDLDNGLLHIKRTETWAPKDREERTIPLLSRFSDWLSKFQGIRVERNSYIARPRAICNNWRYRWDFKKAYDGAVTRAGLECNFHDLRRTFASRLVSNGASIYKVAVWLGDDVEVVQAHYGFLSPKDDDIELMERKNNRIDSGKD